MEKMQRVKVGLKKWNTDIYGNIFQRKKTCKARLLGIQIRLTVWQTTSLEKLERKLMEEMNGILNHEESYWR